MEKVRAVITEEEKEQDRMAAKDFMKRIRLDRSEEGRGKSKMGDVFQKGIEALTYY